jgi:hypothetical protein
VVLRGARMKNALGVDLGGQSRNCIKSCRPERQ